MTDLLYLGTKGARPMQRKPVLKSTRSFDAENITDAAANRSWKLDCTGDGIADMVEVNIQGNIAILPITRTKKFFGGTTWAMSKAPWLQARAASRFGSIQVKDLNGDGLGDIICPGEDRLLIMFSIASKR